MLYKLVFKSFLLRHPKFTRLGCKIANLFSRNKLAIRRNNLFQYAIAYMKQTRIDIVGKGNIIIIDDYCTLNNCRITISGNNNLVHIGERCSLANAELHMENSDNIFRLGRHSSIHGKTYFDVIESTKILIGEDCMFSSDIHFQTGDSHSIISLDGSRINESKDIIIGNHCWIGTKVICLKGTEVGNNCVIGAGSMVLGKHLASNCILGGSPARILKQNINWLRERI